MSRRDVRRDTFLFAIANAGAHLLTAVVYFLAARATTPEQFGPVAATVAIAQVVAVFVDWGGITYITRELAARHLSPEEYRGWMRSRGMWLAGAGAILGMAAGWRLGEVAVGIGAGLLLVCQGLAQPASAPLRAELKVQRLVAYQVVSRSLALAVAVFIYVAFREWSTPLLPMVLATAWLFELVLLRRTWPGAASERTSPKHPWRGTLRLGAASATNALLQLDTPIVSLAGGPGAAGIYAAVSKWTASLLLLSNAYSQAAFPRFSRAKDGRSIRESALAGLPLLLLAFIGAAAVFVLADPLVSTLLGPSYADSAAVLRILALASVPAMLAQPLYVLLQARHRESAALAAVLFAIPTQLGLVAVLADRSGAVGGAWAVLIGQTVLLVLLGVFGLALKSRPPSARPGEELLLPQE